MFSCENMLGLPQNAVGLAGVLAGNLISQEVEKQGKGFKAEYNSYTKKITILNTSDLSPSVLNKILYESPSAHKYVGWYPVVKEERSQEGNLEIYLSQRHPREEIAFMEKSISEGVINAMSQFFNKHEGVKGIWYPNDYSKYLMDEFDIKMNESFYTGFANEKFFEKTGDFTFKLKAGKRASEGLLSFLNGPTVADCGNATRACYYKCILDIIGEEKFDQLFSSKPFTLTLIIDRDGITNQKSPISHLPEYTEASNKMSKGVLGKRPLKVGQKCHFGGIIWYANKHPEGFGGGWNVIYIGDDREGRQLFMAHGFKKPLTENEINQKLVEFYNRERTPQDEQYVIQAKKPELYDRETNKYLISNYTISDREIEETPHKFIKGFLEGSIKELQVNKLLKLKNSENVDQFKKKFMSKKGMAQK